MAGMSALVMNIFVPSLQAMADWFEADYGLMQLSVSGYLLMNAVLQIFIGPISDKMGRRPVILWGTVIFLIATLGCILSTNVTVFLIFRMIQAMIVTSMVLSRAVVRDLFPADEAASRIGYVTMGMSIVPMIAPVIGGGLSEAFGWHANFWVMFGLGAALLWLVWQDLGETAAKSGLTLGQQFREYPELLRSPRFWGYALACSFSSGAFFSYVGGAAFVGTEVFGLSTTTLGLYFGAPAVGYAFGNFISGKFSARIGVNTMVLAGGVIITFGMALSMLVFAVGLGSALSFFGFMTFVGFGNGLTIPNATAGALSVRPYLAGTASGLAGAIMLGGGAALSSLAGALLGPGTGAWPLLWLMLLSAVASIAATMVVIQRERQLGGLDAAE
ncbi:MFS transporter, DHA1 family, bicyclomycin/chloramphenicol resistance protein [Tropicibacter naphthalenivorans]|uniref:Bcr/CflA family efflux transporter n=2 Tax=Tropicibacter naphthalenivorans TaxID=441103 RepID=A0A0N7LZ29_9RHOB|nr:Sulfonamide resistance protein [Tropicibacter naphthalenivorans]SMC65697.1 MFS transporter, DHA1 family, bicyclomycin/chloramphenicol resistance protein [Tropicibacter naphthalenivorans]